LWWEGIEGWTKLRGGTEKKGLKGKDKGGRKTRRGKNRGKKAAEKRTLVSETGQTLSAPSPFETIRESECLQVKGEGRGTWSAGGK